MYADVTTVGGTRGSRFRYPRRQIALEAPPLTEQIRVDTSHLQPPLQLNIIVIFQESLYREMSAFDIKTWCISVHQGDILCDGFGFSIGHEKYHVLLWCIIISVPPRYKPHSQGSKCWNDTLHSNSFFLILR